MSAPAAWRVEFSPNHGGEVAWAKLGESGDGRPESAWICFDGPAACVRVSLARPAAAEDRVVFSIPGWVTQSEIAAMLKRTDVLMSLAALQLPAYTRAAHALDALEQRAAALRGLPMPGDRLAIAARRESALLSGYTGEVEVVGVFPYWNFLKVKKLGIMSEGEHPFALVSGNDVVVVGRDQGLPKQEGKAVEAERHVTLSLF